MNTTAQLVRYKKVLLIDDDEVDLYISSRIMKSASLAEIIETKSSAGEALDYLKSLSNEPGELPEVIFLDLGMPAMDGFDFLNAYSKLNKGVTSHCKIILLTNAIDPDPVSLKRAKNNPLVQKILNKPLTKEALDNV